MAEEQQGATAGIGNGGSGLKGGGGSGGTTYGQDDATAGTAKYRWWRWS